MSVTKNNRNGHSALTSREREVLGLIALGLTDKEIASELFISHHTVISHRKNLLHKLKLKNKVELSIYAIRNGLQSTNTSS